MTDELKQQIETFKSLIERLLQGETDLDTAPLTSVFKEAVESGDILTRIFLSLEDTFRQREEEYRSLIELYPDAVFLHADFSFLMVNQATMHLLGAKSADELIGRPIIDFIHLDFRDQFIRSAGKTYHNGEILPATEILLLRLDGTQVPAEISMAPATHRGKPAAQTLLRDLTARKELEAKLLYYSSHDNLTGLYNRAYFSEELQRLERGRSFPVSIIVADLDCLKETNDLFGHLAGDRLIQYAAFILQDGVRGDDVVARIGGDEFAVILPGTDRDAAAVVIERIRMCELAHNREKPEWTLGISLGVATAGDKGELTPVLILADQQMQEDKAARKLQPCGVTNLDTPD